MVIYYCKTSKGWCHREITIDELENWCKYIPQEIHYTDSWMMIYDFGETTWNSH